MTHLRLVTDAESPVAATAAADRPMVSLRLLMAASGRCSCDDCLWAYRRGNRRAGVIEVSAPSRPLSAVR